MNTALILTSVIAIAAFYFIPSIIANYSKSIKINDVCVLNLFGAFSFIVDIVLFELPIISSGIWIVALVLSINSKINNDK